MTNRNCSEQTNEGEETRETDTSGSDPEEILDRSVVKAKRDPVRHYSADGYLYAYRDDDEHVVVSRGNDPRAQWVKRVPAERTAVIPGEQLWTIPDNWTRILQISVTTTVRKIVYYIPETGTHVVISASNYDHIVDAWFSVDAVGRLDATYDDTIDWDNLRDEITSLEQSDTSDQEVIDALNELLRNRRSFEREFIDKVNLYGLDAIVGDADQPPRLAGWTTNPWQDGFNAKRFVRSVIDGDEEVLSRVANKVEEASVIPMYPTLQVELNQGEGLPDGYYIRALIEADLSAAEAVDYLITEHLGQIDETEWAEIRGEKASIIQEHTDGATTKLKK